VQKGLATKENHRNVTAAFVWRLSQSIYFEEGCDRNHARRFSENKALRQRGISDSAENSKEGYELLHTVSKAWLYRASCEEGSEDHLDLVLYPVAPLSF